MFNSSSSPNLPPPKVYHVTIDNSTPVTIPEDGPKTTAMYWDYTEPGSDLRNFRIFVGNVCLYKLRTDSSPQGGYVHSAFSRFNQATGRFESAGEIEWLRNSTECRVTFGIHEFHSSALRRLKKRSSKSRRFKIREIEYKWKKSDDGKELTCTDTNRNPIAKWLKSDRCMWVTERGECVEDELMVTCMLHQWWIATGRW